jgi:cytochrome c oxidase subunit 2
VSALGAVAAEPSLGLPRDVSLDGPRIDALLHSTALLTGVALAGLCALLAWALWRRRGRGEDGEGRGATARTLAAALALFGAIDGNLLVHGLRDLHQAFWTFAEVDARPDVVRVEIDAHQWVWQVRYAGPDGAFATGDDVVLLNELVVPVGTPVLLALASTDVVHSLYLPNLRLKADAVPGRLRSLWFQATEPGEFDLACAQHCGAGHYKMRGVLRVLPQPEYQAWRARAEADAHLAYDPDDAQAHWGWPWRRP